jgi:polyhydroxybutyrate depolymerase
MKTTHPFPTALFLAAAVVFTLMSCRPASLPATPTPRPTPAPGVSTHDLNVNGRARTYELYVPASLPAHQPAALVFLFHGYGSSGARFDPAGSEALADQYGFLIVKPDGTGAADELSWNGGGCCAFAANNRIDDAEFVRKILADLGGLTAIDSGRIFAAGHSNGAMLAYRLACEMSETFAAVAPVSGPLFYAACQPGQPVAILHVHGLADTIVPFTGGGSRIPGGFPAVEDGLARWAGFDGCSLTPEASALDERVTHTVYPGCAGGSAVELYTIAEHAHPWPNIDSLPLPDVIITFFLAHARP